MRVIDCSWSNGYIDSVMIHPNYMNRDLAQVPCRSVMPHKQPTVTPRSRDGKFGGRPCYVKTTSAPLQLSCYQGLAERGVNDRILISIFMVVLIHSVHSTASSGMTWFINDLTSKEIYDGKLKFAVDLENPAGSMHARQSFKEEFNNNSPVVLVRAKGASTQQMGGPSKYNECTAGISAPMMRKLVKTDWTVSHPPPTLRPFLSLTPCFIE